MSDEAKEAEAVEAWLLSHYKPHQLGSFIIREAIAKLRAEHREYTEALLADHRTKNEQITQLREALQEIGRVASEFHGDYCAPGDSLADAENRLQDVEDLAKAALTP